MQTFFVKLVSFFFSLQVLQCPGDPGDAYGMINAVQTDCEYEALTSGTRLSDVYNSYDESIPAIDRTHHQFYHRIPYFSRMIHYEIDRHYSLPTNTHHSSHKQTHPHFKTEDKMHHNSTSNIAFRPLMNKWIYFLGDGSLRPIISTLLTPFHAHRLEWTLDSWMQEHCINVQTNSNFTATTSFPERSRYYCEGSGYGVNGKISFEWNDMLIEDFTEDKLGQLRLFSIQSSGSPDVIVSQLGYSGCYLAYNSLNGAKADGTIEGRTEGNIGLFIKAFHDKISSFPSKPTVVFSTASRNMFMDYYCDVCTWKMNRKIAFDAHMKGYMVFEREEIEYRLFFKSEDAVQPWILPRNLSHFPVPQIVTSSLVTMLGCMERNISFHLF